MKRRDWNPQLFEPPPRKPFRRRVLMHVIDAGGIDATELIRFQCRTCGHDSGWQPMTMTVTEAKRGVPCPICNAPKDDGSQNGPGL